MHKKNIEDFPYYINSEGKKVYEITLSSVFRLPNLKPEHLSYVYWINWVSGCVNVIAIIFTLAGIIE